MASAPCHSDAQWHAVAQWAQKQPAAWSLDAPASFGLQAEPTNSTGLMSPSQSCRSSRRTLPITAFNRIDIEVLSVIAQQLLQVRQALLVGASDFLFQGTQIRLKPTFGCMITMNPGYAGRTG